jgi:hypothetical protein
MRRVILVSLASISLLASGCEDPDTTDYDPMGAAAAAAGMELAEVPVEQVDSCVELTKFSAMSGDQAAQERWNSVGQSEDALSAACTEIGRTDPDRLAGMHWEWMAGR